MMKFLSLKKAIENNKLKEFIAKYTNNIGDIKLFNCLIASMIGKSKEDQKSSSEDKNEN